MFNRKKIKELQETVNKLKENLEEFEISQIVYNNKINEILPQKGVDIKIKYHNENMKKLEYIEGKSDWIDLRASKNYSIKKGESGCISLGVSMELPKGYEAIVAPRSSMFKNFHLTVPNSFGVIDNSFCGDNDEWKLLYIAHEDIEIKENQRLCQFRIVKNQPQINFIEVDSLNNTDRGETGSTGIE